MSGRLTPTSKYLLISFGAAAVSFWSAIEGFGAPHAVASTLCTIYALANGIRIFMSADLE